jgi:serine/threonine-protein kinase RsbW
MITLSIPSRVNELDRVLEFINMGLEVYDCSPDVWLELTELVKDIFLNITEYAYPSGEGVIKISFHFIEPQQAIELSFFDDGIPYNPLEGLPASQQEYRINRLEGRVGIPVSEQSVDETNYVYLNKKNVSTIKKYIGQSLLDQIALHRTYTSRGGK